MTERPAFCFSDSPFSFSVSFHAKQMRLAICLIYGTDFTGSVETAVLWLDGGIDIGTGVMLQEQASY